MGDTIDGFRAMREHWKQERAKNRDGAADALRSMGYDVTEHNEGRHLIIRHAGATIDYWPGTGKWNVRQNGGSTGGYRFRGRGRDTLLEELGHIGPVNH